MSAGYYCYVVMREGETVPLHGFTRKYEALGWLLRNDRTGLRLFGCRAHPYGDETATYELDIEAELARARRAL